MLFSGFVKFWRVRAIKKEVTKLRAMTIGQIMSRHVVTISPDELVIRAATKMVAEDISCLAVTNNGVLVGVLSERDFVLKVPLSKAALSMKVSDIMSKNVVTVTPSMTLPEAVALMRSKGFRRLIVYEQGRLLGIVTQTDFSRTLAEVVKTYPLAHDFTVSALMSENIVSTDGKESFSQALQKMKKKNVGCVLIMQKRPQLVPVGIFTETDVVMQFYDKGGKIEPREIGEFMRKYVRATSGTSSVFAANKLLLEKKMRRLVIVDGTKIIGILTQTDIVRFCYTALDRMISEAEDPSVTLKKFSSSQEFLGEFRGEHLKVYSLE